MYFPYGLSGGTIDHNVYYGGGTHQEWRVGSTTYTSLSAYQTATGYDTHALASNPLLVNGGGGETLSWTPALHNGPQPAPSAYALAADSPAIDAGATVSGATRDYYGTAVPNGGGYNIGAYGGTVGTPFVTGQTLGTLENNFTGSEGYEFTVGSSPITVTSLGRWVVAGNTGSHVVKLSTSSGDVAGGSVTINTSGVTAGQYCYANLAKPVTLSANATYYIVSHEVNGGDQWYHYYSTTLTHSSIATIPAPVYSTSDAPPWLAVSGVNKAYIPLSFLTTP